MDLMDIENNELHDILLKTGIILSSNDEPHCKSQEQALVLRNLSKLFDKEDSNETTSFLNELRRECKNEEFLKMSLVSMPLKKDDSDASMTCIQGHQDSLLRLLLKVNTLQNDIIDLILDEITKIASDECEDTSWLRQLINPLRYLPYIHEPSCLTTKLLDILEISTLPVQLEILDSIPEIIPDSQYSQTAKQLGSLIDDNDDLCGAIIDCLNALNIESDIRLGVQDKILAKLMGGTSLKIFPILLEFLMTDSKSQNIVQTFLKIRNALDSLMFSCESSSDKESSKILIFNKLQTFSRTPKSNSDAWLNMIISIKNSSDHKPIDLLMLFMLHSCIKHKKRIIEGLIKKKIAAGFFKINMLEKLFDGYIPQQLFRDYFQSMIEIGSSLIRVSQDQAISEFVTTLFRILFKNKYTEAIYRKEILDSLILLTGTTNQQTISLILNIIQHFLADSDKLRHHTIILMRLLEKLDTFDLNDIKNVFEVICALTCGEKADDAMSGLKDEIHIIVRKQLSSSQRSIKHRGIIASVVMAKHIVETSNDESEIESNGDILSIAQLPAGLARDAGCLLELTSASTSGVPELMGLYYDQLASMLMTNKHLNKYFLTWLNDTITNDFEKDYITDDMPDNVGDLEFSMQYVLNSTLEMKDPDKPIGINIAGLTIGKQTNESIVLLAPHFRLLRLLHYRQHDGNLSSIEATLGCGVILPKYSDITDLDSDDVKKMADCLFHCANWFREILSGFVTQKEIQMRAKILERLNNLITIEKQLDLCMEIVPEYKLPVSYFDSLSQISKQTASSHKEKTKNPKKRFKSSDTARPTTQDPNDTTLVSLPAQSQKNKASKKVTAVESSIIFREVDTDLIILLKYPLDLGNENVTQSLKISLDQFKFIIKDYVAKLEILMKGQKKGLSHLNVVEPLSMIKDCVYNLPNIDKHLKVIITKINELLEKTDGRHDLPAMFTEEAIEMKECFGLILRSYYLIFSWTGFQHSKNLDLLRTILRSLRPEQSQTLNSANRLIVEFINRLATYVDNCLVISHAVSLVKIMEALYSTTVPTADMQKKIVSVSSKFLSKRWYNIKGNIDSGKASNANIDILIKSYLTGASIQAICGIVGTLQEEAALLKTREDCLHMLASVDKQNFHIFYADICSALHDRVKTEIQALTNKNHLVLWKTTALTMEGLLAVAKIHENKTNLTSFLKKSIMILRIFLSQGVPMMELMLKSSPDEVVKILKSIQTSTRFLHHLCCASKLAKNTAIMAYVPQFRLILETLVYRVKAALVANNCSEAFWMGNLKNRDLHGEDILTQSTVVTESLEGEESDRELPDDDSDIELTGSDVVNNKSDSEVYD